MHQLWRKGCLEDRTRSPRLGDPPLRWPQDNAAYVNYPGLSAHEAALASPSRADLTRGSGAHVETKRQWTLDHNRRIQKNPRCTHKQSFFAFLF